ncbi:MAG TPA: FecR domain-containing protein [Blastocatellia bacterium]|nr:FecR domain-containing protein [Blastocatellia bacterium]
MFRSHVTNQLAAYCHGELAPEESRCVAEHLMSCQRCRREYEEIRFGVQLVTHLRRASAPATLWPELELQLDHMEAAQHARPEPARSLFTFRPLVAAGVALLLVTSLSLWFYFRLTRPAWEVVSVAGQPRIGSRAIGTAGKLSLGEWLETDDSSRARISVGDIGQVQVEPNSQVKLVAARKSEHRLSLQRGKMHAFIWAPPRQFFVDTPSAVAVDLGCAYTLEVNDDGQGLLLVTSGWVAFEWKGRESFVPAGAACVTRPALGPGTPYFSDSSDEFIGALERFDTAKADDAVRAAALEKVLALARERDALTLWHLLARTNDNERGLVYDRLAKLIPPPSEVTREGVLRGDKQMRDLWWNQLGLGTAEFWRLWKGPAPNR